MIINFLGTSHGIAEADRFTSAILLTVGESSYLFDAGAPVMKFMRACGTEPRSLRSVFITHSHADHYLGLVELTAQIELFDEFSGADVTVFAPEFLPFYKMREFIFGEGSAEEIDFSVRRGGSRRSFLPDGNRVKCVFYPNGEFYDDGTVRVTAIPTLHFKDSHAFVIEAEGKRILLTGDLRHDFADFPELAFSEPLDLIITEAAHPLLDSEPIVKIFRQLKAKKVLITHICPWRNTPDMIKTLADRTADLYPLSAVHDGSVEVL